MRIIKKFIFQFFKFFGYELVKISKSDASITAFSLNIAPSDKITDIEILAAKSSKIPGMVTEFSGKMLYVLCYLQELKGDVVEIGSWQGKSSAFLAKAVKDSKNGSLFCIDHFKGNLGKEKHYIVERSDLSDLKANFLRNMKFLKLSQEVRLFDMSSQEAAKKISEPIRFLFIDGDHTAKGVKRDIDSFFPKLVKGSIVVFDDYSENFPGLVKAVNKVLSQKKYSKAFTYKNTLVMEI